MDESYIERIAESVFQKLLAKQEEWDQHYHYESDRKVLIDKITALNLIKEQCVIDESYELAEELQSKIKSLTDQLKNNK
jgi:hypothetical protein